MDTPFVKELPGNIGSEEVQVPAVPRAFVNAGATPYAEEARRFESQCVTARVTEFWWSLELPIRDFYGRVDETVARADRILKVISERQMLFRDTRYGTINRMLHAGSRA